MKEQRGEKAISVEGYGGGEWILGDFGDLIVHIFTPEQRAYYDLESLWRHAVNVPVPPEDIPGAPREISAFAAPGVRCEWW